MSLSIDRDKFQAADKPTLYKQIRLDIERRILTGEWPPVRMWRSMSSRICLYRVGLSAAWNLSRSIERLMPRAFARLS